MGSCRSPARASPDCCRVGAGSPRNGKWLILKDDGRAVRLREEYIREYDHERAVRITQDDCPAFQKWLEKRELA